MILNLGHQDRRHIPITNPTERRMNQGYQHTGDRRHHGGLPDRRHISPPLHINICENTPSVINNSQAEGLQRTVMDFSNSRRHGRGTYFCLYTFKNIYLYLQVFVV